MIVTHSILYSVLDSLRGSLALGLDTETTGLGEDDSLFSLIIAAEREAYYFNFNDEAPDTPANTILNKHLVLAALQDRIFSNPCTTWYIQNAKFDLRMLAKEGVYIAGRIHCTYAIERVIKNNYFGDKAYSLAGLAERRGLKKDDRVEQYISKNKLYTKTQIPGKKKIIQVPHFNKVPFPIMAEYGTTDGILHRAIGLDQERQIKELSTIARIPSLETVFENEIAFTKTAYRMERRGVLVDRSYTARALDYEIAETHKAQKEFEVATGTPYQDSNKVLAEVFTKLNEPYPMTEKGNPSFKAEVLEEMDSPVAALINKIRYHEKRAGTYYSSFLHYMDQNHVLHPDTRQAGTETGRCSYRDPNLQNVPKEDDPSDLELPYHVRECFIPRPGHFFYSIDYAQQEFRILLDWAGEKKLIEAINYGADVHQATAELCGITRKQAKTINFGLLYGMGEEKLAKSLGITRREAHDLICTYFARLPRVKPFLTAIKRAGETRGFIFNCYGRRCHIQQRDWAYILPNHFVQGTAADTIKIAQNRADEMLASKKYSTMPLLQVHDELLLETPFGEEQVIFDVQKIMESVYPSQNGMKLTTTIEHSFKNWGSRSKIKGAVDGKN